MTQKSTSALFINSSTDFNRYFIELKENEKGSYRNESEVLISRFFHTALTDYLNGPGANDFESHQKYYAYMNGPQKGLEQKISQAMLTSLSPSDDIFGAKNMRVIQETLHFQSQQATDKLSHLDIHKKANTHFDDDRSLENKRKDAQAYPKKATPHNVKVAPAADSDLQGVTAQLLRSNMMSISHRRRLLEKILGKGQSKQVANFLSQHSSLILLLLNGFKAGVPLNFPLSNYNKKMCELALQTAERIERDPTLLLHPVASDIAYIFKRILEIEHEVREGKTSQEASVQEFKQIKTLTCSLLAKEQMLQVKLKDIQMALRPIMQYLDGKQDHDSFSLNDTLEKAINALRRWKLIEEGSYVQAQGDTSDLLQKLLDFQAELKLHSKFGEFKSIAMLEQNEQKWKQVPLLDSDEKEFVTQWYKQRQLPVPVDLKEPGRAKCYIEQILKACDQTDPLEGTLTRLEDRLSKPYQDNPYPFHAVIHLAPTSNQLLRGDLTSTFCEEVFPSSDIALAAFKIERSEDQDQPAKLVKYMIPIQKPIQSYIGERDNPSVLMIMRKASVTSNFSPNLLNKPQASIQDQQGDSHAACAETTSDTKQASFNQHSQVETLEAQPDNLEPKAAAGQVQLIGQLPKIEIPLESHFNDSKYVLDRILFKSGNQHSGHYYSYFDSPEGSVLYDSLQQSKIACKDHLNELASKKEGSVAIFYRRADLPEKKPAHNLPQGSLLNSCYIMQAFLTLWQNPVFSPLNGMSMEELSDQADEHFDAQWIAEVEKMIEEVESESPSRESEYSQRVDQAGDKGFRHKRHLSENSINQNEARSSERFAFSQMPGSPSQLKRPSSGKSPDPKQLRLNITNLLLDERDTRGDTPIAYNRALYSRDEPTVAYESGLNIPIAAENYGQSFDDDELNQLIQEASSDFSDFKKLAENMNSHLPPLLPIASKPNIYAGLKLPPCCEITDELEDFYNIAEMINDAFDQDNDEAVFSLLPALMEAPLTHPFQIFILNQVFDICQIMELDIKAYEIAYDRKLELVLDSYEETVWRALAIEFRYSPEEASIYFEAFGIENPVKLLSEVKESYHTWQKTID